MTTRSNKGDFQPGNRAAAGHHNRGNTRLGKPYSDAAREWLASRYGEGKDLPTGWPEDRREWTEAQYLIERHGMMARAGDIDMTKWLVERAEGKSAMAPEDRAAIKGAASMQLFGGVAALAALQMALGLRSPVDPVESEVITDTKAIEP